MKRKKLLAILLSIALLASLSASLAGCAGKGTENPANPTPTASAGNGSESAGNGSESEGNGSESTSYIGKTLTVACDAEPTTLVSQVANVSGAATAIARGIYNWLYESDGEGNYTPSVATGFEWIDETHLRIFIREGVKFFDGSDLTAEDVIFSWRLGLEGTASSQYESPFVPDEFYAEDDYTVVFVFDTLRPYETDLLYEVAYNIVSKKLVEGLGGASNIGINPKIGSGRYKFVEWVPGQYILLEYNENYWDSAFAPQYEFLKFTFIPDSAARCLAVKSGDADLAMVLSYQDIMAYETDSAVQVIEMVSPATGGVAMQMNSETGPFSDENVRRAFSYLIDWKACAVVFTGSAEYVQKNIFNQASPYFYGADDRSYDFDKGMEYLKQSAYPNGFEFSVKLLPASGYQSAAELIQAQLAAAGIKMSIINMEFAQWFDMFAGNDFEAYMGGVSSSLLLATLYMDGNQSVGGTVHLYPELQGYIETANNTFDPDERHDALINMQKFVDEHALMQGVCTQVKYSLGNLGVSHFVSDAEGFIIPHYIVPAR